MLRNVVRSLLVFVAFTPINWTAVTSAAETKPADSKGVKSDQPLSKQSSVGKQIESFSARDFRGKETSLADLAKSKLVVVTFIGTECPLAKLYGPRLAELAAEFEPQGVTFLAVDSNRQDSIKELANYAQVHGITFPVLKDVGDTIADQLGAKRTPETFVLDAKRVVRYQGRIDDQYGLGASSYAQTKVQKRFLATALSELLAGKEVGEPTTETVGCLIGRVRPVKDASQVTYSNQVARILQKNCVECHRPGQIAPFTLTDYDEVAGWAEMIDEVVRQQRMPPWHADPKIGHFSNDRSLSDKDKETLYTWVRNGAPKGNPADLPPPVEYPEGWQLGQPEQIVTMSETPYKIAAEGTVKYQYFVADPGWKEDLWVRAVECMVGNRAVVHHIFAFAVPPTHPLAQKSGYLGDGFEPDLGGTDIRLIAGAAPGTPPFVGRKGMATRVVAGTKLLFQMHYTPNGSPQEDRTSVGFWFARPEDVKQNVGIGMAINVAFAIPPGADNHPVESQHVFAKDALLLNMTPHMHLRGKSFRYDLEYPDGKRETILNVPGYDFNWQVTYNLAQPKFIPAGTVMQCLAHFNNSDENLANPDPGSTVRWGDQTWEEMMIGWFNQTTDVLPEDYGAWPSRTERFVKATETKPPKMGSILSRAAQRALESDADMARLAFRLEKETPQVDRICASVVEDGQVRFIQVSQPKVFDAPLGRAGRKVPAQSASLSQYAVGDKPVVNQDLAVVKGDDLTAMRALLGSSLHVPVMIDGKRGTVNFWSKEKNAFPDKAVEFLTEVAKQVGQGK